MSYAEFTGVVFGAINIDVTVCPAPGTGMHIDRPGSVFFSLGGTGFNIARSLLLCGRKAQLVSRLASDGIFSSYTMQGLASSGLDLTYIDFCKEASERFFVATFEGVELTSATSSPTSDIADLDLVRTMAAVKDSDAVIVDSNVSESLMEHICDIAWTENKKLVLAAVSSIKILKSVQIGRRKNRRFFLMGMNLSECEAVAGKLSPDVRFWDRQKLLKTFNCSNLLVSRGRDGHVAIDEQSVAVFATSAADGFFWPLGAGDALLAAHCGAWDDSSRMLWKDAAQLSKQIVPRIARFPGNPSVVCQTFPLDHSSEVGQGGSSAF